MGVLIVEQKVREVLKIADRVYVLRNGRVSFTGPAADLQDDAKIREASPPHRQGVRSAASLSRR